VTFYFAAAIAYELFQKSSPFRFSKLNHIPMWCGWSTGSPGRGVERKATGYHGTTGCVTQGIQYTGFSNVSGYRKLVNRLTADE
jgi:hypothetical protein